MSLFDNSNRNKIFDKICDNVKKFNLNEADIKTLFCNVKHELKKDNIDIPEPTNQQITDFKNGDCKAIGKDWQNLSSEQVEKIVGKTDKLTERKECQEPLALTVSTTKNPTCNNNDGEIEVTASGGTRNYIEYKLNQGAAQSTALFTGLASGSYSIEVTDSEGSTGMVSAKLETKLDEIQVEPSSYEPIFGIAMDRARTLSGPITVQWDANSKVYNFTPKIGVTIERIGDGEVRLTTTNPEDKKWEGVYKIYFLSSNHDEFVGF